MIPLSMNSQLYVNIIMNCYHSQRASHEPLIDLYIPPLYLAFNIVGQKYGLHHHGGSVGVYVHMNLIYKTAMFETMKDTCSEVVSNSYFKLFHRFLDIKIMAALGMVYPQY